MYDATSNSIVKSGTILFACAVHGSGETGDGIEPVDLGTHILKVTDRIPGLEPSPAAGSNRCASMHHVVAELIGSVVMFFTFH